MFLNSAQKFQSQLKQDSQSRHFEKNEILSMFVCMLMKFDMQQVYCMREHI